MVFLMVILLQEYFDMNCFVEKLNLNSRILDKTRRLIRTIHFVQFEDYFETVLEYLLYYDKRNILPDNFCTNADISA